MSKFFQSALSVVIQVSLAKLGVGLMMNMHIFWGVACMILAVRTPKFLQDFLITTGGGGGGALSTTHTILYGWCRWSRAWESEVMADGDNDDISNAIILLVRVGAVARFVYCLVRLTAAEEQAAQYKKRARNTVIFYIITESIWQIKDLILYYYS